VLNELATPLIRWYVNAQIHTANETRTVKIQALNTSIAALITALLAGCSSSSTSTSEPIVRISEVDVPGLIVTGLNGRQPDEIFPGFYVSIFTYRTEGRFDGDGTARVNLLDYEGGTNFQVFIDFFTPEAEACENFIVANNTPSSGSGSGDGGGTPPPRLFAGNSVTFKSGDSTWLELVPDGDAEPSYESSTGMPGPMPENATLSIPGSSAFPSVDLYPLIDTEFPIRLSPDVDELVRTDSLFSWMPSAQEGQLMGLNFLGYNADGSFRERVAECNVIDDGNFQVPTDILELIGNYDGTVEVAYFRYARKLDLIDNTVFIQRVIREE